MDPFDDDDLDRLYETREERLAYNKEANAEIMESWSKKLEAAEEQIVGMPVLTTAGPFRPQEEANVSTAAKPAREMGPPAIVSIANSKSSNEANHMQKIDDKAEYLQRLNKRIVHKISMSRSTSDQGPDRSDPAVATSKPRLGKIPPAFQVILDNFANFEQAIDGTQTGQRLKLKKGKGMVALEKYDFKRRSTVFQNCVVAVVHHSSAKGEQLVPRWAHVRFVRHCPVTGLPLVLFRSISTVEKFVFDIQPR